MCGGLLVERAGADADTANKDEDEPKGGGSASNQAQAGASSAPMTRRPKAASMQRRIEQQEAQIRNLKSGKSGRLRSALAVSRSFVKTTIR